MADNLFKSRRMSRIAVLILGCLLLVTTVALAGTAVFDLSWWTVDGGGMSSSGGDFELAGTIGQPDAGQSASGGSYQLAGGYWGGTLPTIVPSLFLPVIQR